MLDIASDIARFDEAIEELRRRIILTDAEFRAIEVEARRRAFAMAGITQLQVVQQVLNLTIEAVARGDGLKAWQKRARGVVGRAWGRGTSHRLELIFRNATQQAYNNGRFWQMTRPEVLRFRPFWMFDAILDGRETAICFERDGTILPADDPWWVRNWPQLHHKCRSTVRTLSERAAKRRGISDKSKIASTAQEGFGLSPAVGPSVTSRNDLAGIAPALQSELFRKQAQTGTP